MLSGGQAVRAASVTNTVSTVVIIPLTIIKFKDLDFGTLVPSSTAGTVTIDPYTSARSTTGGVTAFGGTPQAAQFETYGGPLQTLTVNRGPLPVLTRVGGTQTMNVTGLTLDGSTTRFLTGAGLVVLNVGGTMNVGANQVPGTYVGTFSILVTYN